MQTVAFMSTVSAAVLWLVVALSAASTGLRVVAGDVPSEASVAVSGDDFDRPFRPAAGALPSIVMIARLRTAVQRIEKLADEVDAVLGLVEADIEKDDLLSTAAAAASGSPDASGNVLQQLIDDKRSKPSGASATSKSGRRYDSYGVAGRFGRSVDRQ
jgi:hypothetical protein